MRGSAVSSGHLARVRRAWLHGSTSPHCEASCETTPLGAWRRYWPELFECRWDMAPYSEICWFRYPTTGEVCR